MFGKGNIGTQLIGIGSIGAFTFTFAFAVLYMLKKMVGIRVTEDMELRGLDVTEHEMSTYQNLERGNFVIMVSES